MFKLQPDPTFSAKVPLSVPGMEKPLAVTIVFRHKSKTAFQDYLARMPGRADVDNLDEIIVQWAGLIGPDGVEAPYSREALATLLENYPTAPGEIFSAYSAEITQAKRKN